MGESISSRSTFPYYLCAVAVAVAATSFGVVLGNHLGLVDEKWLPQLGLDGSAPGSRHATGPTAPGATEVLPTKFDPTSEAGQFNAAFSNNMNDAILKEAYYQQIADQTGTHTGCFTKVMGEIDSLRAQLCMDKAEVDVAALSSPDAADAAAVRVRDDFNTKSALLHQKLLQLQEITLGHQYCV